MCKSFITLCLLGISFTSYSQDSGQLERIENFLSQKSLVWNLSKGDLNQKRISDQYSSNNITHTYFQQQYNGYAIENAIIGVHSKQNGEPFYATNTFVPDVGGKINVYTPSISAQQATQKVLDKLNILNPARLHEQVNPQQWVFKQTQELNDNIRVRLLYSQDEGKIVLSYAVLVYQKNNENKSMYYVNATSSEIFKSHSWTINCEAQVGAYDAAPISPLASGPNGNSSSSSAASGVSDGSSYRVFEYPLESPTHGQQTLVNEPADPTASPFGWHDVNGSTGAEYTITRGNNVHAFEARNGNNSSQGNEPDGGAGLDFDFVYNAPPAISSTNTEAATVQLFYAMNMIHDITSNHGFDAPSGNFQQNNYGQTGLGGDPIDAKAQSGLNNGEINNANYVHSSEGFSPTVNMYIWSDEGNGLLTINTPSGIAGTYNTGSASFGGSISSTPLTADIVIVEDDVPNSLYTDGCETIQNDLTGKIVIVDRGTCEFGEKALAVQNAGGVGCIICNFNDQQLGMSGGLVGSQVSIPVLSLTNSDCNLIRQFAGVSLNGSFVDPGVADTLDGDFDNGIIAHEYAHGISTRLTGGPTTSCLGNNEQMGEGWSDFFALALTTTSAHTATTPRGVGTFVSEETPAGRGIRRYPYSTDMTVSPLTYADVALNTQVHARGEVWANMLWEMYWALVDQYGFDPDLLTGSGGNNMALRLVIEGLKLQPCSPGFVDGRDAILAADAALYNGNNACLIEAAFAKRGLGINADQGSANSATDGTENFEANPLCTPTLKINKTVTEVINPGDIIEVNLTTTNHVPNTLTAVQVYDTIPDGLSYISGSANLTPTQQGNLLVFALGDMAYQDQISIDYELQSDDNNASQSIFFDEVTTLSDDDIWEPVFYNATSFLEWQLTNANVNSASLSWYAQSISESSDQTIVLQDPVSISGNNPALKFWHYFDTQKGFDGGVVDYSLDGVIWQPLANYFFKNPYNTTLDYQTFVIPNLTGFSGISDGWIPSYADLSFLNGSDAYLRLRYGTDDSVAVDGWYVDDIEVLDLIWYNAGACAVAGNGTTACDIPEERGTLVNSATDTTTVTNPNIGISELDDNSFSLYPNPVQDLLRINNFSNLENCTLELFSSDGRLVQRSTLTKNTSIMDMSALAKGVYHVSITSNSHSFTKRIIKN